MAVNTSTAPINVPKNMKVATCGEAPSISVSTLEQSKFDSVDAMQIFLRRKENEQNFVQHKQVAKTNKKKQENDGRVQLSFNSMYDIYRQQFENMMLNYKLMWEGHLGRISVTKHCIKVTMKTAPIHSGPYCAGPCQNSWRGTKSPKC